MIFNSMMVGNSGGGSGGGSLKTVNLTINELTWTGYTLSYMDENGTFQTKSGGGGEYTFQVPAQGIISLYYGMQPYLFDYDEAKFIRMSEFSGNQVFFRCAEDCSVSLAY